VSVDADIAGNRDAMTFRELVAWAWRETPPVHENRTNLLIHLVAVPTFAVGHLAAAIGILLWSAWPVALGAGLVVLSLVAQKRGHALECQEVHAFASGKDFVRRLYAEQFCNFRRFLFSGRWYASFKGRG
jgi:hypothetical protein